MTDTTQVVTAGESEQVQRANESGLQPVVFIYGHTRRRSATRA
jgi:hypothetical protein